MSQPKTSNSMPIAVLLIALAFAAFAHWMALPPKALPAAAPLGQFSAERALQHIKVMAIETHPAGSKANDRVCDYIIGQLAAMDVETLVIDQHDKSGGHSLSWRRAVLGRIRGTNPTKAFAVDAHFDSVPYGPGATDDLSGIAAMLETARALKASPPLMNDVIFVFADQEEFSGGGAIAFREHPWFQDVGVMLGLETRGTSGPGLMFETSRNNGFVIREMAKAGVEPRATSIMFDFYDRMPFGSDFGHYKNHVAGLNVAYVDDFAHYHTTLDNYENANPDSVQHHGEYTLGLARHFGSMPLDDCYAPNATYFNTLGGHMVVYGQSWNWPLAIVAWLFFGGVLAFGFLTRKLTLSGVLEAVLAILAMMLLNAVLLAAPSALLFWRFREMALYQNNVYVLAYSFVAVAIFLAGAALVSRPRPQDWLAAASLYFAALLAFFLYAVPGGAYAAVWPLAFSSAGLLILCLAWKPEGKSSEKAIGVASLFGVPAFILIVPALVTMSYTLTFLAGFLLCALFILLLALLAPAVSRIAGPLRWGLPSALFALACLIFVGAYVANLPRAACPRLNCLAYGVDFDADKAYWLSADRKLDEWTSIYFSEDTPRETVTEFIPGHEGRYRKAAAPMPPYGKFKLDVLKDEVRDGQRILDLKIDSTVDAQRTYLRLTSDTTIHNAKILSHTLDGGGKGLGYRFECLPREGTDLQLIVEPGTPLVFHVHEMAYGLPEVPGFTPRPDWMAPEPNRTLDHRRPVRSQFTFTSCTYDFGAAPSEP